MHAHPSPSRHPRRVRAAVRSGQNRVSSAAADCAERKLERVGAAGHTDAVPYADEGGELALERLMLGTEDVAS